MVISDFAYADVAFDGYQTPSFLAAPGAADVGVEFTTMSKGYNMAGWRVGFCCRQRRDGPGAGDDQGLLRLRHVPGRSRSPPSWPCGNGDAGVEAAGRDLPEPPRRARAKAWRASAGRSTPPKASMFVWGRSPSRGQSR